MANLIANIFDASVQSAYIQKGGEANMNDDVDNKMAEYRRYYRHYQLCLDLVKSEIQQYLPDPWIRERISVTEDPIDGSLEVGCNYKDGDGKYVTRKIGREIQVEMFVCLDGSEGSFPSLVAVKLATRGIEPNIQRTELTWRGKQVCEDIGKYLQGFSPDRK